MREELLGPLGRIIELCNTLQGETLLNIQQETLVDTIKGVARDLFDVVISVPDLTWDKAREILSYEAREHLASVIGYAELLLEEEDGPLNDLQGDYLLQIREDGGYLLGILLDLESE